MTNRASFKERQLRAFIREFDSALVAFSGGVDSALVAFVAHQELGDRMRAVTGISPSLATGEREYAGRFAKKHSLPHAEIVTNEFSDPRYMLNPPNRCYYCKHSLYSLLADLASQDGFHAIFDGTNADDDSDVRPGRTAGHEFGVRSPLLECEMTKLDVRDAARRLGLDCYAKPALACLSSRVPTNAAITTEALVQVEEAESIVLALGFSECRVRHYGKVARIEVPPDEVARALETDIRRDLTIQIKRLGFEEVAIHLAGYARNKAAVLGTGLAIID